MDKVGRKTTYIVYVDKSEMGKPNVLCDAVLSHMIKKGYDIADRKRFMAQFLKAPTDKMKMDVVDAWVQVRDAATFPFRKGRKKPK